MTKKLEVVIQLKTKVTIGRVSSEMNEALKKTLKGTDRIEFIKESARNHFGIELNEKEDLKILDEKVRQYYYKDRSEWLRDIFRIKILQTEKRI